MANLTVAEKTHWRDRIQARIDRKIEAITAGDPGLMERIRHEARGRALESLGLAGFQEELDRIAGQRAELDRRDTQVRREMLARVRGVSADDLECYTPRPRPPGDPGGHRQAAGGARGGAAGRARAGPPGPPAPGRAGEPARRRLAGRPRRPRSAALVEGRASCSATSRRPWSARRWRSRRPARRPDGQALSRSDDGGGRGGDSATAAAGCRPGPARTRPSACGTSTTWSSPASAAGIAGGSSTTSAAGLALWFGVLGAVLGWGMLGPFGRAPRVRGRASRSGPAS